MSVDSLESLMGEQNVPLEDKQQLSEEQKEVLGFMPQSTGESPKELPVGFWDQETSKFYRGYEVSELSASALTTLDASNSNMFKVFGTIVAKGLNRIYDLETGEECPNWRKKSSKIFFPDAFFLMTEIIIKTRGSSYISTTYKCPSCGNFTKFNDSPQESDLKAKIDMGFDLLDDSQEEVDLPQENIRDVKIVTYRKDSPRFKVSFSKGMVIDGKPCKDFEFRIPEIGDYLQKFSNVNRTKMGEVERAVLASCVTSVEGIDNIELNVLKDSFGPKFLELNLQEYSAVLTKLNTIGYNFQHHKTKCGSCFYEYETQFDLTNFFDSVLKQ